MKHAAAAVREPRPMKNRRRALLSMNGCCWSERERVDVVVALRRPRPFPLIGQKGTGPGSSVSEMQGKKLGEKLSRMAGMDRTTANMAVTITILVGPVESGGEWSKLVNGQ